MEQLQAVYLPVGSTKHFEDLPDDIILEIFSYLNVDDLVHSVQYVSSRLHSVSQDNHLWRELKYAPALKTDKKIVRTLRHSPKLQTLLLDKRVVGSSVLQACFQNCFKLKKLTFHTEQKLSESVKFSVLNCRKLEYLTINYYSVSTKMIKQLPNLNTLNIYGCAELRRSLLLRSIAKGCPLLQHININNHRFSSVDFKYFMQMKQHQLQSMKISCTTFGGRCTIPYLTECKTLKNVFIRSLCGNGFDGGWEVLRSMTNITALTLFLTDDSLAGNLVDLFRNKGMCHLKELKFQYYIDYKDELCETICNNCPLLKILDFSYCLDLTDRSLENLPKLKDLEYLTLSVCSITDKGGDFVFNCKQLKYLKLNSCRHLTDQCMKQITNLNLLETLILHGCNIEVLPLNLIPTSMTKLRLLSLKSCGGVNREGLQELHAKMPHLTVYDDL